MDDTEIQDDANTCYMIIAIASDQIRILIIKLLETVHEHALTRVEKRDKPECQITVFS